MSLYVVNDFRMFQNTDICEQHQETEMTVKIALGEK